MSGQIEKVVEKLIGLYVRVMIGTGTDNAPVYRLAKIGKSYFEIYLIDWFHFFKKKRWDQWFKGIWFWREKNEKIS